MKKLMDLENTKEAEKGQNKLVFICSILQKYQAI